MPTLTSGTESEYCASASEHSRRGSTKTLTRAYRITCISSGAEACDNKVQQFSHVVSKKIRR